MTSKDDVLRKIEDAAARKATELNLSGQRIKKFPPEICQLSSLQILDLRNNQLSSVPAEISQLSSLQELYLGRNQLSSVPAEISQLSSLQRLSLNENQLSSIPAEISQLSSLQELYLRNNQLSSIPAEICQLSSLQKLDLSDNQLSSIPAEICQLSSLQKLDLRNNQLSSIPAEISQLSSLQYLELSDNQLSSLPEEITQLSSLHSLDLRNNQLSSVPAEICQLSSLQYLELSFNQLSSVPAEISQLSSLQILDLSDNQLSSLPAEISQLSSLQILNLGDNQLSSLPAEISQLSSLQELYLNGNPLPIPPEILAKFDEPATIINYYLQQQQEETLPLNEAKMLVVGQGNVGKTSLVKRLIYNEFNPDEDKTEGIDILPWEIEANESTIQVNVWDFGGQEIYHATHQFFLTKRSLYLLVLDARQGEDANRLEYWLKIIQSYGGESPVIIVGNKTDQHPLDLDKRGLQNKYPNIKAILETSCKEGNGIEAVKNCITEEIAQLKHVGDLLPKTWFKVKTRLEDMEKDYISYEDYEEICKKENVTQEQNQSTLVGFLHDLGIVLNFKDDPRLETTQVLKPEWVTNGVYKILNDRDLIIESKGVLNLQDLTRILDRNRYPRTKHAFIIKIMKKFELCFRLDEDDRYLIPDLLPKEEPDTGEWKDALTFEYHYNVLPNSIISRFIVRTNQYISQRTYWRTGVVLANEGNRALVNSDREEKIIYIKVSGSPPTRRSFLAVARSHFDHIHGTIPKIEAREKVRYQGILFDYQHLLGLERMGEETLPIPELNTRVSLKEILNGFESERDRARREQRITSEFTVQSQRDTIIYQNVKQESSTVNQSPDNQNSKPSPPVKSSWANGLFYLFIFVVVIFLLTWAAGQTSFYVLVLIILGGLLFIPLIGTLQLRQDERLSEKSFLTLMKLVLEQLPLIKGLLPTQSKREEES